MITNGFTYFATLVLIAGLLVGAQKLTKWKFFEYVPPVVLLYLIGMLGCTFKLWDTAATKEAYSALRICSASSPMPKMSICVPRTISVL